jgi:hypothetical protein
MRDASRTQKVLAVHPAGAGADIAGHSVLNRFPP